MPWWCWGPGWWAPWMGSPWGWGPPTSEQEKEMLRDWIEWLREQRKVIDRQISEIERRLRELGEV